MAEKIVFRFDFTAVMQKLLQNSANEEFPVSSHGFQGYSALAGRAHFQKEAAKTELQTNDDVKEPSVPPFGVSAGGHPTWRT